MEKNVVLLHGFGEDHRIFDRQVQALKQVCNVYTPDWPGSGHLARHSWQPGTDNLEWMAQYLKAQLDEKGWKPCILLGHSMGGYIALAMAEMYPDYIAALGLLHSTARADTDAKKETRRKAIGFIAEKGAHTFLKTAIPGLFGQQYVQQHPEQVAALIETSKTFTSHTLSAYYRAMIARPNREHVLKNLKVPLLWIAGTEDTAAPLADVLQQVTLPDVCYVHVLQQTGHMGMLESTELFNKFLLNFIKDI